MSIDVVQELEKARADMQEANDALMDLGFPADQWELITRFIASSIVHS